MSHEHDKQTDTTKAHYKSNTADQLDPNAAEWPQPPNTHKSQSRSEPMLDHADLIDYMYQHVQFDEIPFYHDPLYDHRQIYTHENAFIPFGIYEDVQAIVAFEMEIENEKDITHIESSNTAYMHNVGRTACPDDHTCNPAVRQKYTMMNSQKY